eukprot:gene4255-7591_t
MDGDFETYVPRDDFKSPNVPEPILTEEIQAQSVENSQMEEKNFFVKSYEKFNSIEDEVIVEKLKLEHKYSKLFLRVSIVLMILGILFGLSWLTFTPLLFPWFIYPEYLIVLTIGILFIIGNPNYPNKIYSIHVTFCTSTISMLILTNVYIVGPTGFSFPWCIYPISILIILFSLHTLFSNFNQYFNHFYIHLILFCIGNAVIYCTWAFTRFITAFPWFIFPLVIWFILISIHFVLYWFNKCGFCNTIEEKLKNFSIHKNNEQQQQTEDDDLYNNDYHKKKSNIDDAPNGDEYDDFFTSEEFPKQNPKENI